MLILAMFVLLLIPCFVNLIAAFADVYFTVVLMFSEIVSLSDTLVLLSFKFWTTWKRLDILNWYLNLPISSLKCSTSDQSSYLHHLTNDWIHQKSSSYFSCNKRMVWITIHASEISYFNNICIVSFINEKMIYLLMYVTIKRSSSYFMHMYFVRSTCV